MEQHPIPQQISSYQFRLVGDMTLKQFFQVAGGIVIGLIFYSLPVIGIIKWPFAILSVLLGVAMAFLPFEERPLERWIIAFFRAIYSPTSYIWKKSDPNQKFFLTEEGTAANPQVDAAMNAYLGKNVTPDLAEKLDAKEKGFFAMLTGLFSGAAKPQAVTVTETQPVSVPVVQTAPTIAPPTQPTTNVHSPATANPIVDIKIPETPLIKIADAGNKSKIVTEEKGASSASGDIYASKVAPVIMGNEVISSKVAQFSVEATPPNPPSTPNIVVGQVVTSEGKIVEGAIMEIKDSMGRPIRALRSNKLGHFVIVTPLDNGHYDIITDKEGMEFSPISFDANGSIIPPILVKGEKTI